VSAALSPAEGAALLALARGAIEDRLRRDGTLERMRLGLTITAALAEPRGVFVTLKVDDVRGLRLRGCIGSIQPGPPVHEAVVEAAHGAAFDDPRFPPVAPGEFESLRVSIAVLTPLEPAASPEAIVPGIHGVHLVSGVRRAVFLPQVATEQGWSTVELLENLAMKAGLVRAGWRQAALSVFRSENFGE
jgi:AmmeMemoRadiSam system protein A